MQKDFVKFTDMDGFPVFVNSAMILTIEGSHSNSSKIRMAMDSQDRYVRVKESPDDVLKAINKSNQFKYGI